eukprot:GHVP01044122.1.p2 GENE.GHVP01044122.1~~GHVP01044122.1.p2  ORF type:complete len:110 (-),score=1.28 GHVP01044122.1:64-393(-)
MPSTTLPNTANSTNIPTFRTGFNGYFSTATPTPKKFGQAFTMNRLLDLEFRNRQRTNFRFPVLPRTVRRPWNSNAQLFVAYHPPHTYPPLFRLQKKHNESRSDNLYQKS